MKRQGWVIFLFCGFIFTAWSVSTVRTQHGIKTYNPQPVTFITPLGGDYDKRWKRVDSLQNKGLYKSASELVQQMFEQAIKENNSTQVVKSMMYRLKYNSYIQEEDYKLNITSLEKYSAMSAFPVRQLLHSITAEMYNGFYQQNRWRFYDRSTNVEYKPEDILTWDAATIANKIRDEYLASLEEPEKLKTADIASFKDILNNYTDDAKFRPTLFDFMAHRAYSFFAHNEFDVVHPAVRFALDDPAYIGKRSVFLAREISSSDSLSTRYHAARIIKELVAFHQHDKDPHALIVVELDRLGFVLSNNAFDHADSLYYVGLEDMRKEFIGHPGVTEVLYHQALVHRTQAGKYSPLQNEDNRWENLEAIKICKQAQTLFPDAYGTNQCKALVKQIEQKQINATVYDCAIPQQPSQMNVVSTNMDKAWVRILDTGWDFTRDDDYYYEQEKYMKKLLSHKVVKEFEISLKDEKDFQPHTMEIVIPGLPAGSYHVMISADKAFSLKNNAIAYTRMDVSNLTYMTRQNEDHEYDVYVMNRASGQTVANAKVQMLYSEYDYSARRYKKNRGATYTTDANGFVKIPATTKDYRYFYLDISVPGDRYSDERSYYQYRKYEYDRTTVQTHYFLDRKIYRPGQTIYFKGIRIKTHDDAHTLQTNESVTVTLYDVNYQKVSDLELKTNEYGSFSGSFTAPQGVLNGQMHIGDPHGNIYFSVEEYKRPKFEVEFKPLEGTYRLGDTVTAKGNAKSYSGVNVDGADVKYRVMRSTYYWRWYWWWGGRPNSGEMEIATGKTVTDENGNFEVKFEAKPDKGVKRKYRPYYSYTVFADITDINGETRSGSQTVYASDQAYSINLAIDDYTEREKTEWFGLFTRNLNGTDVDAQGTVTIYKLKTPGKPLHSRKLAEPDRHQLSAEEFAGQFPFDVYKHEDEIDRMERGDKVFSTPFNTSKKDSIQVKDLSKWSPGAYVAEAVSKDPWGNEIKELKYFTLFSARVKQVPYPMPFFMRELNNYCEPGDTARFLFGTGFENARILYELSGKKGVLKKEWITVSNQQHVFEIPVTEEHRGNLALHLTFVYQNHTYTYNSIITVPFTNKQLDITFETFRDKLYPGQEEQWKINIKGKKGDKVAAELMLAMYDASLDAFAGNSWYLNVFNSYYSYRSWDSYAGYGTSSTSLYQKDWNDYYSYPSRYMYSLNWFGYYPSYYYNYRYYGGDYDDNSRMELDGAVTEELSETTVTRGGGKHREIAKKSANTGFAMADEANIPSAKSKDVADYMQVLPGVVNAEKEASGEEQDRRSTGKLLGDVKARKNLAETAFFYPQLETDAEGNVSVKFTMPESLTKWKVMGLGHTKDLSTGTVTRELLTQKDLMVVPNMPRFLRHGDEITLVSKISNICEKDLAGDAQLFLYDALTMKPVDNIMDNKNATRSFNVKKSQSTSVSWTIKVPEEVEAVTYKVVARSGSFSDGEEAPLPVLSNRMLVIESIPLHIRKTGAKTFTLDKLLKSGDSKTLKSHRLTLEFTDNPAWYAVQALPYIMEYPYECAEQTFARFYANSIATHVVNSSPKIKAVFERWKSESPESFLSNLQKNQELKSVLLEETPWVMEAKNESERKKRIGLLFDFNRMSNELDAALRKLQKMQASNGGWPWFPGMRESRYITQHVVTGMGHLDKLGVKNVREDNKTWNMVKHAIHYLDDRLVEDYEYIKKHYKDYKKEQHISYEEIQYMYARSYFNDVSMSGKCKEAVSYFKEQGQKYWLQFNIYAEGMLALALNRMDDKKTPADIVKSLKERSLFSDEMGRYWKTNGGGYYWYENHIETQAMLIECFDEVSNDLEMVDELKVWLLKHKQTNAWHTTKATTEACYVLLMRGTEWLSDDHHVDITVGNLKIDPKANDIKREAGTGYFKMAWSGSEIKPEMGKVTLTTSKDRVSWGALHWQYFEDLDKITGHATPLNIKKQLFIVQDNASGKVIKPLSDKNKLKIGDRIRVRIELRTDRDMEYVHMKDMRAAGFEPLNVFSQYKWQDGLGYYESTRDAATHFFFDRLSKGTYVFEYDLRVTHSGSFSNGITQIQCMYAPEFNSHSEGLHVDVSKKDK